jgi:methylthioribulose-1-phosphate dehydratase
MAATREFYRRGWCLGTSGNFSAVLARAPLELLITASGLDKGALAEGDFVRVDADGRPASGETGRASAETRLHLTVCRRLGAGSVLHTHSVAGTLLGEHFREKGGFTLSGYEMLKGVEGITSHEAERVLDDRPETHGFLLAGHGLYTWGTDLVQARRHIEIFEFLLELTLRRAQLLPFGG